MYVCILYISTVVCHDMFLAAENVMSQMSHCTQPTMYKFFYFKIEIKTKVDLYMACEAMAHSTKYAVYCRFCSTPHK